MYTISNLTRRAVTVALFVMAGWACGQPLRPITIVTSSASIPAGAARIVNGMGLFEKQGLKAKVTPADTGSVASAAPGGGGRLCDDRSEGCRVRPGTWSKTGGVDVWKPRAGDDVLNAPVGPAFRRFG